MSGAGSPEGGNETGSEFRQKFEALQAENKALRTVAATNIAERYEHVRAEDLDGVSIDQLATRAEELHQERTAERRSVLEEGLRGLGYTDEQVAAALEGQSPPPAPASRMEALGQISGTPVTREIDKSSMTPDQKIAYALAQESKG